jgi:hypothetical protein
MFKPPLNCLHLPIQFYLIIFLPPNQLRSATQLVQNLLSIMHPQWLYHNAKIHLWTREGVLLQNSWSLWSKSNKWCYRPNKSPALSQKTHKCIFLASRWGICRLQWLDELNSDLASKRAVINWKTKGNLPKESASSFNPSDKQTEGRRIDKCRHSNLVYTNM